MKKKMYRMVRIEKTLMLKFKRVAKLKNKSVQGYINDLVQKEVATK